VSFLAWTFLLGAAAVIGPIAAHLLSKPRFRREPFTMLRFLRVGQRESHARRKLRDLLILLLRCSIILLIAVLFAQPVLNVVPKAKEHRPLRFLALDDSMSMAYHDGDATLLERAVEAAVDHVTTFSDRSICNIYALASGQSFQNLTRAQTIATLRQLRPVPRGADMEDFFLALHQAHSAASSGDAVWAAVFSDFTPDVLAQLDRITQPAAVDGIEYKPTVASEPIDDAAILSARVVERADHRLSLDVTVSNNEAQHQIRKLTARSPDLRPVTLEVDLAAQQRQVCRVEMALGPGEFHQLCTPIELSLSPGDSLVSDDTFRIGAYIPPARQTNALLVCRSEEAFLFETALRTLARQNRVTNLTLRKTTQEQLSSSDLQWADVAVFSSPPQSPQSGTDILERFLKKGGRLICFSTQALIGDTSLGLWRQGLLAALPEKWVQKTSHLEPRPFASASGLDDEACKSLVNYKVDGIALKGYWLCRPASQSQCIWRLADGTGFLYVNKVGRGLSLAVNTSIDGSLGLLAKSQAWVAFCQYLMGPSDQVRSYCYSTMERPVLYLPESAGTTQVGIENCDGRKVHVKPRDSGLVLPTPAGLGWIKTLDEPRLYVGINLPETEMPIVVPSAQMIDDAMRRAFVIDKGRKRDSVQASVQTQRRPIWKIFAWAAILLVLLESALANRLKR
jgi:hypothetical protein